MSESQPSAFEIFSAALELSSPQERAKYLDEVCGDNADLRQRVERLLEAHPDVGDFMEDAAADGDATVELPEIAERPGTMIGRYKLLQKIGEGGFGVVFMAEQMKPVRRKVAVKVIKPGMDTREVIARFEAERQALAMMDHPNIAKVLDAGTTELGHPYFVMELVHGIPITKYCDDNNLATKERLAIFVQVCRAVQHAHQKGIIHRDLKPSNVMITLHDGVPVPKVIDFGVSKALSAQLTEKTLFTRYGQFIGTPQYMSPEQAEMSGLDIDTRSDVFSLGVILYELLTGRPPIDTEVFHKAGVDEMRRMIRELEPQKPSTKLRTLDDATASSIASHRSSRPSLLRKLIAGDLDWIVMRCLEKDRNRRYETANSLASDVQRHLTLEPVSAGPPSASYRIWKTVRRNRAAYLSGTAVAISLIIGILFTSFGLVRAREQTRRAEAAEQEQRRLAEEAIRQRQVAERNAVAAIREANRAKITHGLLEQVLRNVAPVTGPGYTVRQMLDDFAEEVDTMHFDRDIEAELHATLGKVYASIQDHIKASDHHRRACLLAHDRDEVSLEHARKLFRWGNNLFLGTEDPEAIGLLQHALAIQQELDAPIKTRIGTLMRLGYSVDQLGRLGEAAQYHLEAVTLFDKLTTDERLSWQGHSPYLYMGYVYRRQGALHQALRCHELALQHAREQGGGEDQDAIAWALRGLAMTQRELGDLATAMTNIQEAIAIYRKHPNQRLRHCLTELVSIASAMNDREASREAFRFVLDVFEESRWFIDSRNEAAELVTIMTILTANQDHEATLEVLRELDELTSFEEVLSHESRITEAPDFFADSKTCYDLAHVLKAIGRYTSADNLMRQSCKSSKSVRNDLLSRSPTFLRAEIAESTGDLSCAESLLRDLLALLEAEGKADSQLAKHASCRLARVLYWQAANGNPLQTLPAQVETQLRSLGDDYLEAENFKLDAITYPIAGLLCRSDLVDLDSCEATLREALAALSDNQTTLRAAAYDALAVVYFRKGLNAKAVDSCAEAVRMHSAADAFEMRLSEQTLLGLQSLTTEQDAEQILRNMLERADSETAPGHPERGFRRIGLARFLVRQNSKLDEASGLLEEARVILEAERLVTDETRDEMSSLLDEARRNREAAN